MADSSHVDSNIITTATDASGSAAISVVQSNVTESSRVESNIITGGIGVDGADGADGQGVPLGGTTGQLLAKNSNTDFDTEWVDASSGSGITRSVVSVTSTTTLGATASTDYVVLVGASGAPTLPTAVGNTNRYAISNVHTTNKTISTTSSQTINGSLTADIIPGQTLELVSDNTNWRII